VIVTFAKSKEVKTYDLLVAADGLGSEIRGMMLNSKLQEQLYDEGVHVTYFTIKSDLLQGGRLAKGINATGGRPDPYPAGRTRASHMKVTTSADIETKEILNKALREGNESYMNLMEEVFRDVGWMAPEVLQGMRESDDFYCSLVGEFRSPKIYDGCVACLAMPATQHLALAPVSQSLVATSLLGSC
jgi:2-polyprenyl-6-methoxyphenol hydroxylase-like FAD-dependent oxidoreductase